MLDSTGIEDNKRPPIDPNIGPAPMPTFIIAGAGKSGTSYLAHILSLHPDIFMSTTKEPAFFSTLSHRGQYHSNLKFYAKNFLGYEGQPHVGEGSTVYMVDPQSTVLLKKYMPDVKLIFMLRESADRVYSNYWQDIKGGNQHPPFKEMLFEGGKRITEMIDDTKYIVDLERFVDTFPRENILVLLFEDMKKNRLATINKILVFLSLEPYDDSVNLDTKVNATAIPRFAFIARFLANPTMRRFIKNISPSRTMGILRKTLNTLRQLNQRGYKYPEMDEECRTYLNGIFEQYNHRLAIKFDLDLSSWKK